ncbi:MAG: ABC transporter ATP-binding protein [Opitutaceae bacterium]
MSNLAASVAFRGVSKRFGDGPLVLADIDLAVEPGAFVSIIGPSGCGKSTLLRLVSALTATSAGELLVDEALPARKDSQSAFIFQDATLLPWRTVKKNIELPLRIRGVAPTERTRLADEMLRLVRLDGVAASYPRQLSGGMKMRVSVARALAQSPRLLLLDEPFGALDAMTRHHLNEELVEMHAERGWTALFVTHSVAEAVFLSDRVIVMAANPGRVHADVPILFSGKRTAELRDAADFHRTVAEVGRLLRSVETAA